MNIFLTAILGLTCNPLSGAVKYSHWVEDSRAEFLTGTAEGGLGTDLYVTADGSVMPVGNDWDLNDDGYIDLVLINEWKHTDTSFEHNTFSYIYWGNPSGFSELDRDSFYTVGAEAAALADINNDGYIDLIVANTGIDVTYDYSYIYWGKPEGFSMFPDDSFFAYPNHGSISVADVNGDGYLDALFSNWSGSQYSYLYWGSEEGYDFNNVQPFLTGQTHGNYICDLNNDGYLDVLFIVYSKEGHTDTWSYIFYGSPAGFSENQRDSVFTYGGGDDISIADLNGDGLLDIVIPNHSIEPAGHSTYLWSYIYYQSDSGFLRDSVFTVASWSSSVADLNDDGFLDIVFSCFPYDFYYGSSFIYWGGPSGYSTEKLSVLPTEGGSAVMLADYNNDGYVDICFGNQYPNSSEMHSFLYWNSSGTLSGNNLDSLKAYGVDASITKDLGNIFDRKNYFEYISSIFDSRPGHFLYVYWDSISWACDTIWHGELPLPTSVNLSLEIYIRTGNSLPPDTTWTEWIKVANNSPIPGNLHGRFIQYKAKFISDFKASIALKKIVITYHQPPVESGISSISPNPFKNVTRVDFTIGSSPRSIPRLFVNCPQPVFTELAIFDVRGRLIKNLLEGFLLPDYYTLYWDGKDNFGKEIGSGVYILIYKTPNLIQTRRLLHFR